MTKRIRPWLGPAFCVLFLCPWILGNAECNAFSGTADKTSAAALTFSAQQLIDKGDYDGALVIIAQMSTADRNKHDGRVLEASARAGKCGLNMVNIAYDLANNLSTKTFMQILLLNMKSATSYADCVTAQQLIAGIATSEMTQDDYVFRAFIDFAGIGAVLETIIDANHDGVVDGDTICTSGTDTTDIGTIGVALDDGVKALNSSGLSIASSITSQYTTFCNSGTYPCGQTNPAGYSSLEYKAIRTVIRANEIGLNTCNGTSSSLGCICP